MLRKKIMNREFSEDTIVAVATPIGLGALSIVRLSGERAFDIVNQRFRSNTVFIKAKPWRAIYGKIYDDDQLIDEVIVTKYKSPYSYTKENIVEISCHGGSYLSQKIVELFLRTGARLAEPGEFTLRAFLNGRIDLSQAEAVADLIQSQTEFGLRTALNQLDGKLSHTINDIRTQLVDSCSLLELELDFSDEDIEFVDRKQFLQTLVNIQQQLSALIDTYKIGRLAREGVKLVIAGKPNVGKSSLLNVMAREDRAIVTDIPGTTRDPLEVLLDINGVLFRIYDTAGITASSNKIEQEGVKRSLSHLKTADIVVHLFDGASTLENEDIHLMRQINEAGVRKIFRVVNKIDIGLKINLSELFSNNIDILQISALKRIGIKKFEQAISSAIQNEKAMTTGDVIISNVRHLQLLEKAQDSLAKSCREIEKDSSAEFVALYLREALDSLGHIVGAVTSEDILNNIFSRFCIGK